MKQKILIVDDNIENLTLLSEKMTSEGYEVATASNGSEGLAKVMSFSPDIVLLDVMMPIMDGFETCRKLKDDERTRYIPVVMLTAKGELEDKIHGLDIGAEDYIVKPYNLFEVSARVKSLLKVHELQARLKEAAKVSALADVVNGIAHEIRNPLVTIGGLARRLYESECGEKDKRHYAKTILDSVLRMETMMRQVDEYKAVLSLEFTESNINSVVRAAFKELKSSGNLNEKDIEIISLLMSNPPKMWIDTEKMKLAILNIMENSIESIDKRGALKCRTSLTSDGDILIRINDNGKGIKESELKSVFNPFHTSKTTGAGLGLSISYRVVTDHGGEVHIESTEGEGTEVDIILPPRKTILN
jgi:DNA-binding response OmpR family regulator